MRLEKVSIKLPTGFDYPFPRMISVEQRFPEMRVTDVAATVKASLQALGPLPVAGKRIAVTAGSRGIPQVVAIYRAVLDGLKAMGAKPFIVTAMGSHGGATAEGQRGLIEGFGLTEQALGAPILASMDTVQVATLDDGTPVYCDRHAHEADGIVVVNKIKAHSNYKADYESGLAKMMAIGLGKHLGAVHYHHHGFARFHALVPDVARAFMKAKNVVFAVGIVENATDDLAIVEAIPTDRILAREKELLAESKRIMGKILVPRFDVLIVDEIGKEYSGQGMDPNVTGRATSGLPGFPATGVQRIVVRNLTDGSHGNAAGIGNADLIPMRCADRIDFDVTYINGITATNLAGTRLPMVLNNDRECLAVAMMSCNMVTPETIKVVRVKNTKKLYSIWLSESYLPEIRGRDDVVVKGDAQPFRFDGDGNLTG